MDEHTQLQAPYTPTAEEIKERDKAYGYLEDMRQLKEEPFAQFSGPNGQRSWLTMIDDSERILNGYTMSRDEQGKEEWQANMLDNVSRVKMRAIAAGVGLTVPEMEFEARNENGVRSLYRAEIAKQINRQTFIDENPRLVVFQEVWHMMSHGVVFEYQGYKTGGAMRERIESFDSLTGEITTKKEYVKMTGRPFSILINPQDFFWWDMYTRDIQDQQRLAWVQYYSKAQVEEEFSKYKNFTYIKDKKESAHSLPMMDTTFYTKWSDRVEDENDYEVFRLYDKERDKYQIFINGVMMFNGPLLWGEEEKEYPFAKQVSEPYANTNFFVGMPFGQIMEAYQEHKNTVINTMIDKLYRSMKPPMLYGLGNKDLLDVQDQFVDEDNRFYVPDINQVKPYPYPGLNGGEFNMLTVLDRGIETLSIDRAQQGQQGSGGKTAREVVIADKRAQELKGILYMALEDLWLQKTKLRNQIVMTHYLNDKAVQEKKGGQIISIKDYTFGDGARGILDIHIAKTDAKRLSQQELEAMADAMEEQGIPYKIISITKKYLNDWKYDILIVPKSFVEQEEVIEEEKFDAEVQWVATVAPEFLVANKEKYLAEKLEFRGKRLEDYNMPKQQPAQQEQSPTEQGASLPANPVPQGMSALEEGQALLGQ